MRNNIITLFIIALAAISCSGNKSSEKSKITGTWVVDKVYISRAGSDSKYLTEKDKTTDSMLTARLKGTTYTLNEDGKVNLMMAGEKLDGTWQMMLDKDGKTELSGIEMKGKDWAEAWMPSVGESLFSLKGMDNYINVKIYPPNEDGSNVVYELSRKK